MENFEICETYTHFDQIASNGKIFIYWNPEKQGPISEKILFLDNLCWDKIGRGEGDNVLPFI